MKFSFLVLLLVFGSQSAFAGNPDQDLIVDMVRERFTASRTPTLDEMKPGKTWRCVVYNAQRGFLPNYNTIRELFKFKTTDQPNQLTNELEFVYQNFILENGVMTSKSGCDTLFARVTRSGALVFENVGAQPKRHKAYRAIANDRLRALDYVYCK